jgi:hypothetical protein
MGINMFEVIPCLAGGTEWKMDVWQGSVTDGVTLRARRVLAPFLRMDVNVGQLAVVSASGRTPSSVIRITGGMDSSIIFLIGS